MNGPDQLCFVILINNTVTIYIPISDNTGMSLRVRKIHAGVDIHKLHLLIHCLDLHILVIYGKMASAYTKMILSRFQIHKRGLCFF